MPITGIECVKIVTNLAVIDVENGKFILKERAPGVSVSEIIEATEGELIVPEKVTEIKI